MTAVHRIFSPAFLHRPEVVHPCPTRASQETKVTTPPTSAASSGITSNPWEGLYLEIDEDAGLDDAVDDDLPSVLELEKFLAALMSGE